MVGAGSVAGGLRLTSNVLVTGQLTQHVHGSMEVTVAVYVPSSRSKGHVSAKFPSASTATSSHGKEGMQIRTTVPLIPVPENNGLVLVICPDSGVAITGGAGLILCIWPHPQLLAQPHPCMQSHPGTRSLI